jgi:hypothetical protein
MVRYLTIPYLTLGVTLPYYSTPREFRVAGRFSHRSSKCPMTDDVDEILMTDVTHTTHNTNLNHKILRPYHSLALLYLEVPQKTDN